ncbi:MAG: hypothetical protein WCG27_05025, partial [Pseudomonadota bacterium]
MSIDNLTNQQIDEYLKKYKNEYRAHPGNQALKALIDDLLAEKQRRMGKKHSKGNRINYTLWAIVTFLVMFFFLLGLPLSSGPLALPQSIP